MAGKWLAQTPGSVSAGWGSSSAAAVGYQYKFTYICMYVHTYTHFEYLGFEWPVYSDFWNVRTTPFKKIIIICDCLCPKRKTTASALGLLGVKELSSAFGCQVGFWRKVGNVYAICFFCLSQCWEITIDLLRMNCYIIPIFIYFIALP